MRVIITGGTGLIGRSLVAHLARTDYEIIVLSRRPAFATQMFLQQGLTQAATNRDFLRTVRHILKRFPVFPLPAFVLRILLGELSTVMLDSQHHR